jgi:hypothetical protein
MRRAAVKGCLLASFTVQDFGTEGIKRVKANDLKGRLDEYLEIINYPKP